MNLKKFLVIYTSSVSMENMQMDPEARKKEMEKWGAWMEKVGSGMVDMGMPLGDTVKMNKTGGEKTQSNIVGYSILQAENMDGVKKLLEGHPHLEMGGCEIEVHESLPMPGM